MIKLIKIYQSIANKIILEKDMEWTDEVIKQCARPTGKLGRDVALALNEHHAGLWKWGLDFLKPEVYKRILDIGCGGGGVIKLLAALLPGSHISAIDYSADMVALSKEQNQALIEEGVVDIQWGNVAKLPFNDNEFHLITAFETSYYWPDLTENLKGILRILAPGGILLMVNEGYKHKTYKEAEDYDSQLLGITLYSPSEYRGFFREAGFSDICIHENHENKWITISGKKANRLI
jgi:SAM-dependent methyltransferase